MRLFWQLAIAVLAGLSPVIAAAAEPKRMLLLNSFGRDFGAYGAFAREFRAELERKSPEKVEFFDAALMTERFGAGQNEGPFVDYLQALFAKHPLDLITAVGAPAVRFVQQHRLQLFPSTPILLAAVEQRRISPAAVTANDTVASVSIDFASVVKNILLVLPETTAIAVVIGNSPNEQYWSEQIRSAVQPYTNQLAFTWLNDLSFDEMLKRAATLPPKSAIFFYALSVDAAGHSHERGQALARLRVVANAPIFTYIDTDFGNGIVGGALMSVSDVAQQTASVAMRILNGEAPSDIKPSPIGHGTPKYDWRELQRWNIAESRLPPGSEVHFHELTAWEQYRNPILLTCFALLLQAALIVALFYERRRRQLAEIRSRNSMAELTHMNRVATAGELSASIAHEVNQPLAGIVARAGAARRWLARETPDIDKARAALDQIESAGHRASDIIKNVKSMFRKDTADNTQIDLNLLMRTVLELVQIDLLKNRIVLQSQLDNQLPPVRGNEVQLQQVALNLIVNAIDSMHSVQKRVLSVESKVNGQDSVHVSIEDTGIGIDPCNMDQIFRPLFTTKEHGMGMGLSICRSIIESHDGRIWVTTGIEGGAVFHFELPAKVV